MRNPELPHQVRAQLEQVAGALRLHREQCKITRQAAAAKVGVNKWFLEELETCRRTWTMSTMQTWARMFELRLDFVIDGFWEQVRPDAGLVTMHRMSRPLHADAANRLWTVTMLQAWREAKGISRSDVAATMGMTASAVHAWESRTMDPIVQRVLRYGWFLHAPLRIQLTPYDQWKH